MVGIQNNLMTSLTFNMRDKADTAGIFFLFGVIEPDSVRQIIVVRDSHLYYSIELLLFQSMQHVLACSTGLIFSRRWRR